MTTSPKGEPAMNALKDLKLDEIFDDLRTQASKRLDDMLSEGRKQARKSGGGHDDTALFSAFTVGILAGALAGAAIALLMTPFSGQQARAKLSERVEKMRSENNVQTWSTENGNGKPAGTYEPGYTTPKPV
jgi:hypothetical protein